MKSMQADLDLSLPTTPANAMQPPPLVIECDEQQVLADYANFCRISGTPEEVLLDFGLHTSVYPQSSINISHRVVMGWHTAKRLLNALQITLARNESVFGVLETDVEQRVLHTDVGRRD